ncbi:MarR family winged helix-turn-helix transcriptional regulator [Microtetraspora malaysiensis]|uniref:MarR family winged helix-turn-helix transcriptional regulator n=1 Tax=Microtetraspora malaysiensis TaxID=161358 RepID=UPI003D8CE3DD
METMPERAALGALLRHVLELLDGDVAKVYDELGLPDYRPRFSPYVRVLVIDGPASIRELAAKVGVTHSAASQTVAQLARSGLVVLEPGADARQRIVSLTPQAREILPVIEAEWAATAAAARGLDAELPMPLADLLAEAVRALRRMSFRDRIAESGLDLPPAPGHSAME